ncbi:DUF2721 domain-containing protein [Enterovirga sp. GCM10030262]|uniref:DUF2721 domain-containing protein n=1 Tax=Enterovirga sp. GCM10030262 TaxID=3273391 RepID=UPI0036123522
MTGASISTVAQIIQLSVAPVFLLAGIGGILNVVANRLARVVDRVRSLERDVGQSDLSLRGGDLRRLSVLDRRMRFCHWSIALCVVAALLICLVVVVLFIADLVSINFAIPVSLLFIAAMISLTIGLLLFLAEVTIATRSVRVNEEFISRGRAARDR